MSFKSVVLTLLNTNLNASMCTKADFLTIPNPFADTVRIWDDPYNGQIRLVSDQLIAHSYGRVEIFQGEWGTVCKHNFNEVAAISICRQLGYTGAVAVSNAQ